LLFLAGDGKSGYDIRLLFRATPLGLFSDSPGAIYPALARLEARDLLASRAETGGRRRRAFFRTPAGDVALDAWLDAPVDAETAARRPHELDLRYVLIAMRRGPAAGGTFLRAVAAAFDVRIAALEAFRAGHPEIGAVSKEALGLGIRVFQARRDWCLETAGKGDYT
jgi:DNA-binding PadR family transcriptional regulator